MPLDPIAEMRQAVEQVMTVTDVTLGDSNTPLQMRGTLTRPAEEAFTYLRERFEAVGHTPHLRREDGQDIVRALPTVFAPSQGTSWGAIVLLVATILSVFYVGVGSALGPDMTIASAPLSDILAAIPQGLAYTAALLGILGAHEMGHYLMARRRGVHTTLPFFIPLPINMIGTMGAVIAMREPAPNRRVQFDIGVAGPLAGLIVAIPVLIIGLMTSEVRATDFGESFFFEGNSLLYLGIKYLIFGRILPGGGEDVWISSIAWAGWVGLFVTALNLLPVGQLDGGHVMYGLFGEKAQWARGVVIAALVGLAGLGMLSESGYIPWGIGSSSWGLWAVLLLLLVRRNAPVLDEITELDTRRKIIGIALLVVFILIFVPSPLRPYFPPGTPPLPLV